MNKGKTDVVGMVDAEWRPNRPVLSIKSFRILYLTFESVQMEYFFAPYLEQR